MTETEQYKLIFDYLKNNLKVDISRNYDELEIELQLKNPDNGRWITISADSILAWKEPD